MASATQKVAIGLPVFNGERFLAEVLDSILGQTFGDFVLAISDNASTDGTGEICLAYAARDRRVRYTRNQKNIGAAANYNKVFQDSTGEYFKWATADDLLAPDFLRRCVDVLDAEDDVILAYPKTVIIDEAGKVQESYEDGLNLVSGSPAGRFLQVIYNCRLCNAVDGLIRRSELHKTRLIPDYVGGDKVLLAELSLLGKFREVPEFLFSRRFYAPVTANASNGASHKPSIFGRSTYEQLAWLSPNNKHDPALTHWNMCTGYLSAIKHAPINLVHKVHPTLFILARLLTGRKYRMELRNAARKAITRQRATTKP